MRTIETKEKGRRQIVAFNAKPNAYTETVCATRRSIHCDENATTRDYRRSQFVAYDVTVDNGRWCCDVRCGGFVSMADIVLKWKGNKMPPIKSFRRFLFSGVVNSVCARTNTDVRSMTSMPR